jgi:hypothetical protein
MADEVTISASLQYTDSDDPDIEEFLQIADLKADVATLKFVKHKQSIATSEEAINLAECTSPGWAFFKNADPTNFINLRVATGGAIFAKLLPGEICVIRLGSGAQAPYAISDSAACMLHYLIIQT